MTNKSEPTPELVSLIFDGSKSLWQSKMNITVKIAGHIALDVLEIIVHNSESGIEAPRIFASRKVLKSKINQIEFEEKFAHQKEALIRRRMDVDIALLSSNIINDIVVQYIVSRLDVLKTTLDNQFRIVLTPTSGDTVDDKSGNLDVICSKPEGLVSFHVSHTKHIT
jgi:hypothetical protein